MAINNQLIIPAAAHADANSREVIRAWVVDGGLHVSVFIPDGWHDPGNWGIALCDVARHLADAYRQQYGSDPQKTLQRIHDAFLAEFSSPTDSPSGGFVDE